MFFEFSKTLNILKREKTEYSHDKIKFTALSHDIAEIET